MNDLTLTISKLRKRGALLGALGLIAVMVGQVAESGAMHWLLVVSGAASLGAGAVYGLRMQYLQGRLAQASLGAATGSTETNRQAARTGNTRSHPDDAGEA